MTSTGQDADNQAASPENPYPGYCADHAAVAAQYGWTYIPYRFPGCAGGCEKPDGFDLKTQPHLSGGTPES